MPGLPWQVEHAGSILSKSQKKVDKGARYLKKLHGKKPSQEFVPFGEKALAKQISTATMNIRSPRYKSNNRAECFIGDAREIRRFEAQSIVNCVIGVHWRLTDGRWTVDKPEVRVDPSPIPPVPFAKSTSSKGKNHTKKDIDEFGATVGSPGCTAIKDNKRAQAHSDRCRVRIEELPPLRTEQKIGSKN